MSSTRDRDGLLGQHSRPHQPIAVKGSAVFAEGQRLASPHLCDSGPHGRLDEAIRQAARGLDLASRYSTLALTCSVRSTTLPVAKNISGYIWPLEHTPGTTHQR